MPGFMPGIHVFFPPMSPKRPAGAGRTQCLECGGDGNRGKFERAGLNYPCPDSEGAGYQLVGV
jgi:hypothetical protein